MKSTNENPGVEIRNSFDYIQNVVLRCESKDFAAIKDRITTNDYLDVLRERLEKSINGAALLDLSKKMMVSGKTKQPETWDPDERKCSNVNARSALDDVGMIRILHAAMGVMTEAGELLKQVAEHLFERKPLDNTNLKEEFGDILWYIGLLSVPLSTDIEQEMVRNGNKLAARYPDKFDAEKHDNRDLEAERKVLESNGVPKIGDPWPLGSDNPIASVAAPADHPCVRPVTMDVRHEDLMIPINTKDGPVCVNPGLHRFIIYMRATNRDKSELDKLAIARWKDMYNTRAVSFRQMWDDIAAGRISAE
jgi:NTP pyrophosphatase (non-canonical NTP hydrolase)